MGPFLGGLRNSQGVKWVREELTPSETSKRQEAERSRQENTAPVLPSADCSEVQWFLVTFPEPREQLALFSCGVSQGLPNP